MSQVLDDAAHIVFDAAKKITGTYYCEDRLYLVCNKGVAMLVQARNPAEAEAAARAQNNPAQ